jgi:uncharacterized SAM-binding protein YcdF (DUF218 family)
MFLLQKIISPLFFPLNIGLEIILLGILLLWWSKRQKMAKILITSGFVWLLLCSNQFFSDFLLGCLEKQYQPILTESADAGHLAPFADVKWIVVLGGGHSEDERLLATSRLADRSLGRVVEAIRLHRLLPRTKLLFSGGVVFGQVPEADSMVKAAELLGVEHSNIVLEAKSRDTKDQVVFVRELIGEERFLLVTSAGHMPRAAAMFHKLGFNAIPAPCDQRVKRRVLSPSTFYPRSDHLNISENAVYEFLGLIIATLSGRI